MKHTHSRQDRYYRRGLVLGFTMAEIMVLILFAILMALGATLLSKEQKIKVFTEMSGFNTEETIQFIQEVRRAFPNAQTIDEQFKEIRMAIQNAKKLDDVERELANKRAELESYKEVKALLETAEKSTQYTVDQLVKDASLGKQIKDFFQNQTPPIPTDDVKLILNTLNVSLELADKNSNLEKENATLKGQLINLTQRLGGRGTEYPPCWVADNGKPDYIYDVALKTNGYVIRDRKLSHRQQEQALLPVQQITFDTEIPVGLFAKQTEGLLNWGKEHNCRFFVRIFDQTGQQEKDNYKHKERVLQQSFYSYEVLNERF